MRSQCVVSGRRRSLRGSVILNSSLGQAALDTLSKALKERRYTGGELLDLLPGDTDFNTGFLLLNMLWHHGLIDQIIEFGEKE